MSETGAKIIATRAHCLGLRVDCPCKYHRAIWSIQSYYELRNYLKLKQELQIIKKYLKVPSNYTDMQVLECVKTMQKGVRPFVNNEATE